ncbi:hypothetical protein [Niveispirillum sp. KHB5.9]|uniref:hypothetical protein n=1 Tax=Niveispirillum sp. KHB5.9 TaxID=3400269 RepID=UPI003A8B3FB5
MKAVRFPIRLTALALSAIILAAPSGAQAPAAALDMAGKLLMISNDDGTSEQRFQADGSYVMRPVGRLAVMRPGDVRKGSWRMVSGHLLCTRQTEPAAAEEGCLNLAGRRLGESWSFLAVRGGMTQMLILPMGEESKPAGAGS